AKKFAPSGTENSTQIAAVNRNFNTAQPDSLLRTATSANPYAPRMQQTAQIVPADNPLDRLAAIMSSFAPSSTLRTEGNDADTAWQVFPPSLYSRLSLTPAQMMMLDDFNA